MTLWQKTKLFLSLKSAWKQAEREFTTKPYRPMKLKPGITTTEFWTTIGLGTASLGLAAAGMLDGTLAAGITVILGAVYTAVRGVLKVKDANSNNDGVR